MQDAVIDQTGANDRGLMDENFVVLRETKMPAVLVEMGFLSTYDERMMLISETYRTQLAQGIAEGVIQYFNQR